MIPVVQMRAITVHPGVPDSARLDDVPEPPAAAGAVLACVRWPMGVCGTDLEIVRGGTEGTGTLT